MEALWRLILTHYKGGSIYQVLSKLVCHGDIAAAFPNLSKLAIVLAVLPVTTATVKHSFISMKLFKTKLRSRMGEDTQKVPCAFALKAQILLMVTLWKIL